MFAASAGINDRPNWRARVRPQFIFARMLSVFSATFDRAQNAAMHRLHEAQRTGQIKSFVFPYLGQKDRELPNRPRRSRAARGSARLSNRL
jgi:hypothetical protein